MLDGYNREPFPKLGGLVTAMPPTHLPAGSAAVAEDVEYTPKTVRTRRGISQLFQIAGNPTMNGLGMLIRQAATATSQQILIAFDSLGNIYKEPFVGAGILQSVGSIGLAGLYMFMTAAYDRAYMAFSSLITSGTAVPQQYHQYQNQYYLDAVGLAPPTLADVSHITYSQLTSPPSVAAGDVPQGVFYLTVLYMTRSGYITGINPDAIIPIVTTVTNKQLVINNIPLGPSNCIARILAFTVPGTSSVGPFYYIPLSYTVQGLNGMVTSTQINDNTTTTVYLNFTANALISATDVTQYFDKLVPPAVVGVKYVKSLDRMAYWGSQAEPSTLFLSEPSDPETLFATKSRVIIAMNDGQRIQTLFEYRGEVYVAKERGGHVITPNNTYPSTWDVQERWQGVGPCGPRALDVCEEFAIFAHRSGAYRYEGGDPVWVSWEHSGDEGLWARINWAYGHLVSVKIDTETRRVFFCVPLDQATVPNKILVLDYRAGFATPVVQDYTSNLITTDGRKWAVYNIPCNQIIRAERLIPAGANSNSPMLDNTQNTAQLLLASSANDGAVNMFDTSSYLDNGKGIFATYQFAYHKPEGIAQLGGYDLQARGNGQIGVTQLPSEDKATEKPPLTLQAARLKLYTAKTKGQSDIWTIRVHTVNPGDWWEVGMAALWTRLLWPWSH